MRRCKNGAARALLALKPDEAKPDASVFGMSAETVARRFKAACRFAGVDATAHSARVAYASELTRLGASTAEVMHSGGWTTARTAPEGWTRRRACRVFPTPPTTWQPILSVDALPPPTSSRLLRCTWALSPSRPCPADHRPDVLDANGYASRAARLLTRKVGACGHGPSFTLAAPERLDGETLGGLLQGRGL